jgi:hypothetical protein
VLSLLPQKNLVLVVDEARCDPADFIDIADRIRSQAADIRVQVLQPKTIHSIARDTWDHPTLFLCLVNLPDLRIKRGNLLVTRPIPKLQQSEMMKLAHVPTPHAERYRFGMVFDAKLWASHVILKPEDLTLTSHGTGLEIIATKMLSGKCERDFPPDHFARSNNMLVQNFIDTGRQPVRFRAMTFLGEVLYISKITYAPQKAADATEIPADFHSKSSAIRREFQHYPHVHDFAKKVAAAFRQSPLLGCDILQEHTTGNLYAIEVNAGGNVWHFSSPYLAKHRQEHPEDNVPRLTQYNAFDTAAKALINATRRQAI